MKKSKIDFRTGKVFPWHFQLMAIVTLVVAIALSFDRTIISLILAFISLTILTGSSGVEISSVENTYREYLSFLMIKSGKTVKYPAVEKIFINTSKVTQRIYTAHTNRSSIFTNVEYNGFIKFTNGIKIHLMSKRKKSALVKKLNVLSEFLNTTIEDHTV